jgi:putative tricarboxylic transport membrane protein
VTKRSANIILGVILSAFGIFITCSASLAEGSRQNEIGPSFFPMMAGILLALLGAYTAIHDCLKGKRVSIRFLSKKFLLGVASLVIFTILLKLLGYILSGIFAMAAIMLLMLSDPLKKKKQWIILVLVGILAPIVIFIIFAKFLLVPLPTLL